MADYAVTYQSQTTGKVNVTVFTEPTPSEARKSFHACYRHDSYNILSVVEVPDVKKVSGI